MADVDENFFMRRAIELAKCAWGDTHPNPMVGAVIVKNGKIIGEGWHKRDGDAHAEINALNSLKSDAKGADIYVTLEPCSSKGRTGACSDAIITAGIARVIIGALDPNPLHAGRAVKIFKDNEIKCSVGMLEKECAELNIIFNHAISKREAFLALKVAATSNGKIAEISGTPSAITGGEARKHAMRYRKLFPAIGVGFGTLVADNPSLTCREEYDESCGVRLIFDRELNSANLDLKKYKVFSDAFAKKTFIVCDAETQEKRISGLSAKGVNIIRLNTARNDEPAFWNALKRRLYEMGITGLIVEGGSKIISSIAVTEAADYMFEYVSPKKFPESALDAFNGKKPEIKNPKKEILGEDICFSGYLKI